MIYSQYSWEEYIPLKENRDSYQPSNEEIIEYGEYFGLTFPEDSKFMPLLVQGLKASLPPEWQACTPPNQPQQILYRNKNTKVIQMEHPLDDIYRDKIFKLKKLHSNMQMDQIDEERESMLFESSVLLRKSKQEANVINIDDEDPFLDNITEESGEFQISQNLLLSTNIVPVLALSQIKSDKIQKSHRVYSKTKKQSKSRESKVSVKQQSNDQKLDRIKKKLMNYFPEKEELLSLNNLQVKGASKEQEEYAKQLMTFQKRIEMKKQRIEEMRQKKKLKLQLMNSLNSVVERRK